MPQNYVTDRTVPCTHCGNNIDKHAIPFIQSDEATNALAVKLQQQLDTVLAKAIAKGYSLPQTAVMAGAAIATVGSKVIKVAALSGANASTILGFIQGKSLGTDVVLLGNNVPLSDYKTLLLEPLTTQINTLNTGLAAIPAPTYPIGACAGQKMIQYIVNQSNPKTGRITKINMAEIFWKTGGKSVWSTGQLVPSCNTCNRVLPMLLCNYNSDREQVPYKLT
ncbi:hypothetical protein BDD43_3928 [Mucilaginibacter gracilis]|uniref:Uncharacterized protein n=1 Tax=Mucilaginibacter gracilis TaxID=423350 RepID=A0A495J5R7_9SPHI|nr:hypothetical protein [Mucilaginibacter gracilis]RKR83714.1 hypothetical protein BDD43_3928 [Mucilaginibacter gracilis]